MLTSVGKMGISLGYHVIGGNNHIDGVQIEHHLKKYLLETLSPIVGWCEKKDVCQAMSKIMIWVCLKMGYKSKIGDSCGMMVINQSI